MADPSPGDASGGPPAFRDVYLRQVMRFNWIIFIGLLVSTPPFALAFHYLAFEQSALARGIPTDKLVLGLEVFATIVAVLSLVWRVTFVRAGSLSKGVSDSLPGPANNQEQLRKQMKARFGVAPETPQDAVIINLAIRYGVRNVVAWGVTAAIEVLGIVIYRETERYTYALAFTCLWLLLHCVVHLPSAKRLAAALEAYRPTSAV